MVIVALSLVHAMRREGERERVQGEKGGEPEDP